jgi:hypothetical protein
MGERLQRVKDGLWQVAAVAAVPAILGVAFLMKPAPMPDNDRPFWSDADHLRTCPDCRSGLTEFNAKPAPELEEKRDVAREDAPSLANPWQTEARTALDG